MIKEVLGSFLYIFYPKRCKLCGEVTELKRELCSECENTPVIKGEVCEKCGREKSGCVCKKEKFSPKYKAFTAPYYYEGSMKKAVIRFKENSYKELAAGMSERIAESVKRNFKDVKFDAVCCVPMTVKKRRRRGYNQSELLAKETARLLNAEYRALLRKTAETKSQRFSSADERRTNLYGAFELSDGESADGKTILIIDDVKTTGSTLNECASVLRGNKAEAVYAAAFCVTNKK